MKQVVYEAVFHHAQHAHGFTLYANMEECEKHLARRSKRGVIERRGDPCFVSVPDEWYNKLFADLEKKRVATTFLDRVKPKKIYKHLLKKVKSELRIQIEDIERERA